MKDIICKNCTSIGHIYRDCPHPVNSYGVICYKVVNGVPYYIMIQRKNSLSFMEFIKGNYQVMNTDYVRRLMMSMTKKEHDMLLSKSFEEIWDNIWFQSNNKNTKEYVDATNNFQVLTKSNTLQNILNSHIGCIEEPEWGFPKGRKKQNETDIECSLREFNEETQFCTSQIAIKNMKAPYIEMFYGTNNVLYKHTYFLAEFIEESESEIPSFNMACIQQIREIGDIKWFTSNQVLTHINSFNEERIELFRKIDFDVKNHYI